MRTITDKTVEKRRRIYDETAHDVFICGTCEEVKEGKDFYFNRKIRNGRDLKRCKVCVRADFKTMEKRDRKQERWDPEAFAKRNKAKNEKREKTPEGKRASAARAVVRYAVRAGILHKPDTCSMCGTYCNPEAHHILPAVEVTLENVFDVQWVCRDCHMIIHHG